MATARKPLDWDPKADFKDLTPEQDRELMSALAPEVLERTAHQGPWLTIEEAFPLPEDGTPSTSTP